MTVGQWVKNIWGLFFTSPVPETSADTRRAELQGRLAYYPNLDPDTVEAYLDLDALLFEMVDNRDDQAQAVSAFLWSGSDPVTYEPSEFDPTETRKALPPRSALINPRPLKKEESEAVALLEMLDGISLKPYLKKKVGDLNKGSRRVWFDDKGKQHEIKSK